jgi:hypothetical protein
VRAVVGDVHSAARQERQAGMGLGGEEDFDLTSQDLADAQ